MSIKTKIPTGNENEFLSVSIRYDKTKKVVILSFTKQTITQEDGCSFVKFEPYGTCNFNYNLCDMKRLNTNKLILINTKITELLKDILPLFMNENKNDIVNLLKEVTK